MSSEGHGVRRRRAILSAAADLSTAEGLESLSFRRIADEVGLTKAGVAAHFESKEALQLAIVDAAATAYAAPLVEAAKNSEPGLPRLHALALAWLEHLETIEYRGGCFFGSAGLAFAGRPGPGRQSTFGIWHFLQAPVYDGKSSPFSRSCTLQAISYDFKGRRQDLTSVGQVLVLLRIRISDAR